MSMNEQIELLMEIVNDMMTEMQEDEELFHLPLIHASELMDELHELLDDDS